LAGRELPSREQLLGGSPARRASTLLFAIEARTAQLVARAHTALTTHVSERSAAEEERAFLAAVAGGRDARPVRVQDLDRYAPRWGALVPPDPQLRAALGRLILRKYRVHHRAARLRAAIGLDDEPVVSAYAGLYGHSPHEDLQGGLTAGERLRWLQARFADRLENLPPFWTAFALTLTETVGGGILALPIALAGFGPLAAVALLVVFGLVNVVTLAALVESITRNGQMRYGTAYFGRLVSDYLGRPGLVVLTVALIAVQAVVLLIGLTGFGDVLGNATGMHPGLWAAALFALTLLILARGSLGATVASAIVVGSVNLVVLLLIAVIAFGSPTASSGGSAPAPGIDPITLALAFGVLVTAYFGHMSAGNVAKHVLARDPGGRSLLMGNVAAMVAVIAVYAVVVSAIYGALDQRALVGERGTVITPLADALGAEIHVLGAIYASLALGIGSLYGAWGLFNLTGEVVDPLAARLGDGARAFLRGRAGRFLVRISGPVGVFVLLQVLLVTGSASFTGPLAVLGTLAVPVLAGVFPMLMVAAARRRGNRLPERVIGLVGSMPLVWAVWALFLAGVLAHVVIWPSIGDRLLAGGVALGVVGLTSLLLRRGILHRHASLEVRYEGLRDREVRPIVAAVAGGRAVAVTVTPLDDGSMRADIPPMGARSLQLWAHRTKFADESDGLPLEVRIEQAAPAAEPASLRLGNDGRLVVPVGPGPVSVYFSGLPFSPTR
jgi:amino acid permease